MIQNEAGTLFLNPRHVVRVTLDFPIDIESHRYKDHMSDDEKDRVSSWRVTAHTLELAGVVANQSYELYRSHEEWDARDRLRSVVAQIGAAG